MSTDRWRHRAGRALARRLSDARRWSDEGDPHYVVCGADPLAYRLVKELLAAGDAHVTVIVPSRRRADAGPLAALRGIRRIYSERLDAETFRAAGLESATALGLMQSDDLVNLHAALCAQEVNPRIRLVIRMFNPRLAQGVRHLLTNCAVLSDAAMAAPAFVAASLGEVAPAHFRLAGRTFVVARRADVPAKDVVCGLAITGELNRPEVLPSNDGLADLVLAEATGRPSGTVLAAQRLARLRRRRQPITVLLRGLRSVVNRKILVALLVVLAVVALSGAVLAHADGLGWWDSIYVTLLTAITGASSEPSRGVLEQVAQVALTVGGLALVPLLTAVMVEAVVHARLALDAGRLWVPRQDHIVVVGLGNVGTRVIRQLHDLGVELVAIDKDGDARGASLAHQLKIPLIVGDAAREETLAQASVHTAQALVVLSTDDVTNLQAALNARGIRPDLRVVLRLFDGDFADRVQRAFDIGTSRSVSYLVAPAFAAQMVGREVVATVPIERHVLLVAEVPVGRGSALDGSPIADAGRPGMVRVIGVSQFAEPRPRWSPPAALRLSARDRLIVVARRSGLAWLNEQAAEPDDAEVRNAEVRNAEVRNAEVRNAEVRNAEVRNASGLDRSLRRGRD